MPQMYPMNWLFLFIFFSLMYTLMMMIFYFSKKNYFKKIINTKNNKNYNLNWKW